MVQLVGQLEEKMKSFQLHMSWERSWNSLGGMSLLDPDRYYIFGANTKTHKMGVKSSYANNDHVWNICNKDIQRRQTILQINNEFLII